MKNSKIIKNTPSISFVEDDLKHKKDDHINVEKDFQKQIEEL